MLFALTTTLCILRPTTSLLTNPHPPRLSHSYDTNPGQTIFTARPDRVEDEAAGKERMTLPGTSRPYGSPTEGSHELEAFLGKAFEEKPLWIGLYESIHDRFFPPHLPPLELTSTPIPVPDRMAVKTNPGRRHGHSDQRRHSRARPHPGSASGHQSKSEGLSALQCRSQRIQHHLASFRQCPRRRRRWRQRSGRSKHGKAAPH